MSILKPIWHSMHLFVATERDLDALVLETGSWIADRSSDPSLPWFFIRYTEGGVHLRLRVLAVNDNDWYLLSRHMEEACKKLAGGSSPDHWAKTITVPTQAGEIYLPGCSVSITYVPETIRYGGQEALAVNEDLFRTSSNIACEIVRRIPQNSDGRIGVAMRLMVDTLAGLSGLEADPHRFFGDYAASWSGERSSDFENSRRSIRDILGSYRSRASCPDEDLPNTISGKWIAALRKARRRFEEIAECGAMISPVNGKTIETEEDFRLSIASITHSQIHMLNNRLGLWPDLEISMAKALAMSQR
jgi:thiopeptide-type bacteriocin biosynthesis protein